MLQRFLPRRSSRASSLSLTRCFIPSDGKKKVNITKAETAVVTADERTSGADNILAFAATRDIDMIFCSPIAVMAPLWESLAKRAEAMGPKETSSCRSSRPMYLNCRHELLAVCLAAGYYRFSGRPQMVILPTALGVLNGSMGLRSALQERTPMLVLSPDTQTYGTIASEDPGSEWPSLLVDHHGPARVGETSVKWAKEIKLSSELLPELRRALYISNTVPRGPTLLQIPFEIMM